jgi:hypothetical protein
MLVDYRPGFPVDHGLIALFLDQLRVVVDMRPESAVDHANRCRIAFRSDRFAGALLSYPFFMIHEWMSPGLLIRSLCWVSRLAI